MNKQELLKYIKEENINGRDVQLEYILDNIKYKVSFCAKDKENGINILSIVLVPEVENMNNQIVLETNNLETNNVEALLEQAAQTAYKLSFLTKEYPAPIVVPIIPSQKDELYYQQLSKECFEIDQEDEKYRIDNQIVNIIEKNKNELSKKHSIDIEEKVFLNGYSSSGVFAQRFSMLHPDKVDTLCVGGASGTIPIPTTTLSYPIGIENYDKLTGEEFNLKEYLNIKFRYYVGELEYINKTEERLDEYGNPAPKHDMSYFSKSVPEGVGKKQRKFLGKNILKRADKTV